MFAFRKHIWMLCLFLFLYIPTEVKSQQPFQYNDLFITVQENKLFNDQKKFPDCIPKFPLDTILNHFNNTNLKSISELKNFIAAHYDTVLIDTFSIFLHIEELWSSLKRMPEKQMPNSTLINLPYPYIIPGGRFREIYYWDSYFTMLGLQVSGHTDIIRNMIDNFCYLIDQYGFIPNGNRTYYLSRSQPPFFALMIDLLAKSEGDTVFKHYLPHILKEYQFWMNGKESLSNKHKIYKRLVYLEKNGILNRYYDELELPRPESYLSDIKTQESAGRSQNFYRQIRAAAESGWDFSSRWFIDSIENIHTTDFVPVDLNCILYKTETIIAKAYTLNNDLTNAEKFIQKANKRAILINKYLYNEELNFFSDYDLNKNKVSSDISLAGCFPLFVQITDSIRAKYVMQRIKDEFLQAGGLVTTLKNTGEQWDWPNGWPPLQWIAFQGLENYNYTNLAHDISERWLNQNMKIFFETGKMTEKYNVVNINIPGGGGEYPLQDGFGWTNGVFIKLWNETH